MRIIMDIIKFNTTLKASGKDYFKIVFWNRFIRNIGLSEIIRMLENNVTFTQAADSVLECITDSMDVCDAVVMQIDRESDTMHVISETGNCFKDESGTVKRSEFYSKSVQKPFLCCIRISFVCNLNCI